MDPTALVVFLLASFAISIHGQEFISSHHLKLDGVAEINPDGSVRPFNATGQHRGQVFYTKPLQFKNSSTGAAFSFSTTFVFSANLHFPVSLSEGISFLLSPSKWLFQDMPSQYIGDSDKSLIKVTFKIRRDFTGIEKNHFEINIKSLTLIKYSPLGYYGGFNEKLKKLNLTRGEVVQVWVEYDGIEKELNITLSPVNVPKSDRPLLCIPLDITPYVSENMYVGISTSSFLPLSSSVNILGWSFKMNGQAQDFDHSQIAKFTPRNEGFWAFKNWTFIELKCFCVENYAELSLNFSKEAKFLSGNNESLRRGIGAV